MYKIDGEVIIREDGAFIPRDKGNKDYRAFLEWEKQGNQAEQVVVELPIARGKDLLNYLIKAVREQSNQERLKPSGKSVKLTRFQNIFTKWKFSDTQTGDLWGYLQVEEGNFTQAEFDDFVNSLINSQNLNNMNGKKIIVDSVIALIQQWASTVRFV